MHQTLHFKGFQFHRGPWLSVDSLALVGAGAVFGMLLPHAHRQYDSQRKPREKPYKMADSGGSFSLVNPSGAR
jgi:hypothetical protein